MNNNQHFQRHEKKEPFPFKNEICDRLCRWLDIERTEEIDEALVDITGDTYFEMRKMLSQLLKKVEQLIEEEKYPGFQNGKKLTDEQKKGIKETKEDLKQFVRYSVEATWRTMLNKQKVGIDKLSIALRAYINIADDKVDLDSSNNGV